jgi:transposase
LLLRNLLRYLRGPVKLFWDGGSIHTRADVKAFLRRHPMLTVHRLPAYAPELNPNELVWTEMKNDLANGGPEDIRQPDAQLRARSVGSTVPSNSLGLASSCLIWGGRESCIN